MQFRSGIEINNTFLVAFPKYYALPLMKIYIFSVQFHQFTYTRLTISGVEVRIRRLGQSLSMSKVHPHKFRRTLATMAIDKGMPIEQVQRLLGHVRIDTTLHYAIVNQNNVKLAHKKYLG